MYQCLPLVEKMISRIKSRSSKLLSYSGSLQLVKSVLFEMQTYWAHIFLLPKKIISIVTSGCRTFLWTGSNNCSRKALVAWEKICRPKTAVGLNVIDILTWNRAAICKLLWPVEQKKDKLWVLWVHTFYIKSQDLSQMETPKQACWLLRKVIDARKCLTSNDSLHKSLHQMTYKGEFSIKKSYLSMLGQFPKADWSKLVLVKGPIPRHHFILWMALYRRLSTVDIVAKWEIVVQQECVLCDTQSEEKFDHIFFACPYAKHVCCSLVNWLGYSRTIGDWNPKIQWLIQRISNSRPRDSILGFCFAATAYHIWVERNGK
ncbi:uncharacterized protein LOC132614990 [Lycium barbarum]|uniref:uncharacterized protein LOC132614990 n=1 Tax=Lycium barbarum TaxID=112863 RepID=UPI00293EDEDA|nr:uncharacterized protein LOC132614990 [Lycium barbarum]XP_060185528.1 uncharacterized protein LOC132614990 [Lycium barbarum]XP_060185529.1 uncharacterized protein LOC132614990 [Lycium barbarum]